MPKLVKDGCMVDDDWRTVADDEDISIETLANSRVMVPLTWWIQNRSGILSHKPGPLGVWLNSDQMAEELGGDATEFDVIGVRFPGFMDGRGFSTARLLRERYGFKGELRAFGDIFRDQFYYLKRCGFNSFAPADESDLQQAVSSLEDFSESYQAACDQPLPLFKRRNA